MRHPPSLSVSSFFFTDPASTELYTLSLHDALPISLKIVEYRNEHGRFKSRLDLRAVPGFGPKTFEQAAGFLRIRGGEDRKSTRLNSSHRSISYAVFCLKKKKKIITIIRGRDTVTST